MADGIETLIERSSVGQAIAELDRWREFGNNLRERRKLSRVYMHELEKRSGLRVVRICEIELGREPRPTIAELAAYCKALDIEPPEFPNG